ncbi:hypothetical protein [Pseudomarimonas arenosa]|nr:hypothetical protein [Pseudomarimonas arenosa]
MALAYRSGLLLLLLCLAPAVHAQQTWYVATNGADSPGRGSEAMPFATITYALDQSSGGDVILVEPGVYNGRIRIRGQFTPDVTIRSRQPYRAQLRHSSTVLTIYDGSVGVSGVAIEGFDIAHSGAGAEPLVVQMQSESTQVTERITLRDNILHDSFNNDILKINNGARQIRILGNLFYNQTGSDEHIDINSVEDVLVEGNVFFNDFAASGRVNGNNTSSYIVIKDSNAAGDAYLGARDIRVRRNVFLNWQGSSGSNFLLCGEDGTANFEAFDLLIENNLMLGNAPNTMRAAFGAKGCRDVVFRNNTVVGDLPSLAFAMRLNREGSNPQLQNIQFYNNIWSDPGGSMDDFSDTPPADTQSFTLDNNLYYNGGNAIPMDGSELVNVDDDSAAVLGDPELPLQTGLITPVWNATSQTFGGGHTRIADAFQHLAANFGRPAPGGAAVAAGRVDQTPADDILGLPRGAGRTIGAAEPANADRVFYSGFEG